MVSWRQVKQKASPIGLDIGASGVRAVQLERSEDHYRISLCSRAEMPVGSPGADGGSRMDGSAPVAVQNCLSQANFRGRAAITGLSSPDLEFHSLELPSVKSAQMFQIVQVEVKRLLAEPWDGVETSHWLLPNAKASAPNAIGVGASRDKVVELVNLCAQAGASCCGVDASAAALARLGCLLHAWDSEQVWGVVDLGYRQARLTLCVDKVPVLVRTIGAGGALWTQRIAESLGTSVKTAEVQKQDHGIALTARGVRAGDAKASDSQLASVLLGILRCDLNDIASQIKRSYEYVLECYPSRSAADLILVGGGAKMVNLATFLSGSLGIPVHPVSEYVGRESCRLRQCPGQVGILERIALAVGLAIGD